MEKTKVLIVVDLQNDFCPGGSLAVTDGDKIIPIVNKLLGKFDLIIFTADWHPEDMDAFASQHPDKNIFDPYITKEGIKDVLWPDHCVADTEGSMFHKDLNFSLIRKDFYIFKKGLEKYYHPYSGFGGTDLSEFLKEKNVSTVYVCGLATDYCVKDTALDSAYFGFETIFIMDATKPITEEGKNSTILELSKNGISIINSDEID
jgi:nicotinamidase/pyrazinamidase